MRKGSNSDDSDTVCFMSVKYTGLTFTDMLDIIFMKPSYSSK
jgi:hypothetical protein